jgi:hypothetical protein
MEKSSTKILAASVIFTKMPKVNNHPIGENSSNLVTLAVGVFRFIRHFNLDIYVRPK